MKLDDLIKTWRKELSGDQVTSLIERAEERAAIIEFDAGIARLEAERLAMEEMDRRMKAKGK